jgi:hypothetical protein
VKPECCWSDWPPASARRNQAQVAHISLRFDDPTFAFVSVLRGVRLGFLEPHAGPAPILSYELDASRSQHAANGIKRVFTPAIFAGFEIGNRITGTPGLPSPSPPATSSKRLLPSSLWIENDVDRLPKAGVWRPMKMGRNQPTAKA